MPSKFFSQGTGGRQQPLIARCPQYPAERIMSKLLSLAQKRYQQDTPEGRLFASLDGKTVFYLREVLQEDYPSVEYLKLDAQWKHWDKSLTQTMEKMLREPKQPRFLFIMFQGHLFLFCWHAEI